MRKIFKYIALGCSIAFLAIGQAFAQQENSLSFETNNYSFGTISEDTTIVYGHLDFVNQGNENLIITHLIGSCSCVEAQVADSIVKPGQKSSINFSFKPLNYPGQIDKQIFIYTNKDDNASTETIFMTGFVTPTTNPINEFRFSFGNLYVKQKLVRFRSEEGQQIERISCYNNSDTVMSLSVATDNLPQGIQFRTEPEQIQPHSKAELIFSFDPTLWKNNGEKSFALTLKGVEIDDNKQPIIQIKIE